MSPKDAGPVAAREESVSTRQHRPCSQDPPRCRSPRTRPLPVPVLRDSHNDDANTSAAEEAADILFHRVRRPHNQLETHLRNRPGAVHRHIPPHGLAMHLAPKADCEPRSSTHSPDDCIRRSPAKSEWSHNQRKAGITEPASTTEVGRTAVVAVARSSRATGPRSTRGTATTFELIACSPWHCRQPCLRSPARPSWPRRCFATFSPPKHPASPSALVTPILYRLGVVESRWGNSRTMSRGQEQSPPRP